MSEPGDARAPSIASAPRLSVIIPTQGRATLRRALGSIRDGSQPPDVEIVVVADTHSPLLDDVATIAADHRAVYVELDAGAHGYGHPQILAGYRVASGGWLLALGDDDEYLPGALWSVLLAIAHVSEPVPIIFRIEMYPSGSRPISRPEIIWRTPTLSSGNVSGQSIAFPNDPRRLPSEYPPHSTGDFDFICDVVRLYGGDMIWRHEVICWLR